MAIENPELCINVDIPSDNISELAKFAIDNKIDLYIVDLSSKNGVYINGNKINESTILENNDKISLGNFSFTKEDLLEAIKIYENLKREGKQKTCKCEIYSA